jgi:N-acetylneuraminate synthase
LLQIEELCSLKKMGMRIGFSNHGYGIAADIAAWVIGAEYIERHFVDDRTVRHTDAAASLEPDGLRRLCRDLKNVSKAMTYPPNELCEEELEQSKKMRTI